MVSRKHLLEVGETYFNELNQMFKNSSGHSPNVRNLIGSFLFWFHFSHCPSATQQTNRQKQWSGVQSAADQITVWDTGT